jgi:hypothetical protein
MTRPVSSNGAVNECHYDPNEQLSRATEGAGGAGNVSGEGGSEGAGNVERRGYGEPLSLRCLPQELKAAQDCSELILSRSLSKGLVCGLRLEELRRCLTSDGD